MPRNKSETPITLRELAKIEDNLYQARQVRDFILKWFVSASALSVILAKYVHTKLPDHIQNGSLLDWILYAEPQGSVEDRKIISSRALVVIGVAVLLEALCIYYEKKLSKYRLYR